MEARKTTKGSTKAPAKKNTRAAAPVKTKKAEPVQKLPLRLTDRIMLFELRRLKTRKQAMRYWKNRLMTADTGYSVRKTLRALSDIEALVRLDLPQIDMEGLEIAATCILRIAFAELLCNVTLAEKQIRFLNGAFVTEAIRKIDRKNVMYRLMQKMLAWHLLLEKRKAGTVKREVTLHRDIYRELLDRSEDRHLRQILARDIYACMETLAVLHEHSNDEKDREILLRRISLLYCYFDLVMLSASQAAPNDLMRLFTREPKEWKTVWAEFRYDYRIWLRAMDEQN